MRNQYNETMIAASPLECFRITNGEQKIIIKKSRPLLETPFVCYIYCKLSKQIVFHEHVGISFDDLYRMPNGEIKYGYSGELMVCGEEYNSNNFLNGKVIGAFICDAIYQISAHKTDQFHGSGFVTCSDFGQYFGSGSKLLKDACMNGNEALKYLGDNMTGFAWHISKLMIFDKPKGLSDYFVIDKKEIKTCPFRDRYFTNPDLTNGANLPAGYSCSKDHYIEFCRPLENHCKYIKALEKPPKPWCYVYDSVIRKLNRRM